MTDRARGAVEYPGWRFIRLAHPVDGSKSHEDIMRLLTEEKRALTVFVKGPQA